MNINSLTYIATEKETVYKTQKTTTKLDCRNYAGKEAHLVYILQGHMECARIANVKMMP